MESFSEAPVEAADREPAAELRTGIAAEKERAASRRVALEFSRFLAEESHEIARNPFLTAASDRRL